MSLSQQEFCNSGKTMLGRAQAGEVLNFNSIVIGSGVASMPSDLWPLTQLLSQQMSINISSQRNLGNGVLLVEGNFTSNTAPHPFYLHEIGVLAAIGTETPQLYSVANAYTDPPAFIDPTTPTVQPFKIKLIIDRVPTSNITVTIGPSEAVIFQNLGTGHVVAKNVVGNILNYKTLVAGPQISITEDTAQTMITIGQSQLVQNFDLYVPTNHPRAPNPSVAFPSVQAAHDYLLQWVIPPSVTATIHVWSGTYSAAPINFSHPNSQQIILIGEPRVDVAVSQIAYLDPTHKNVTVASALGLFVGQSVYLTGCLAGWAGGATITAIAGNVVTLNVFKGDVRPNFTTLDTGTGRRLSYFPTVLQCSDTTQSNDAITFFYGMNTVQSITVVGGRYGMWCSLQGTLIDVMLTSGFGGIFCDGNVSALGEFVVCNSQVAIQGVAGDFQAFGPSGSHSTLLINGCANGLYMNNASIGALTADNSDSRVYIAHCDNGITCWTGSVNAGCVFASTNDYFIDCELNGTVKIINNTSAVPTQGKLDNNGLDIYCAQGSYVTYSYGTNPRPSCSPAADIVGNQNSYIHLAA